MYVYPKTVIGNDQVKHGSTSCNICLPEAISSTRKCCRCKEQRSVDFMVMLRYTDPHVELVLVEGLLGTGLKCVLVFCTEMPMRLVERNHSTLNKRFLRIFDHMANEFNFFKYLAIESSDCSLCRVSSQ